VRRPDWWAAGHVRRDSIIAILGVEVLALVAGVLLVRGGATGAPSWSRLLGLPLLLGLFVLVTVRVRHRSLPVWIALTLRDRRRRVRLAATVPRNVPLVDVLVGSAQVTPFADRTGMTFGVLRSGRVSSVTMAVESGRGEILTAAPTARLPLKALRWVLTQRDIELHEARLVVHQAGEQGGVPRHGRRRVAWVSLSIDPMRCPGAVQARGGGTTGLLRALTTQAARLAVRCSDVGVRLVPLDGERLRSAIALCAGTPGPSNGPAGTVSDRGEGWRRWSGGAVAHTTFWVERMPRGTGVEEVLDLLAGLTVESVTVSLAVRSAAGRAVERLLVRIGSPLADAEHLEAELTSTLAQHGFRVVSLRGQQLAGVRATLPAVLASGRLT
jgi:type VII secretion protein EccE